jgi:hypothetical protein
MPTRKESLLLLAAEARSGRTAAIVALAREMRVSNEDALNDWILNGP